MRILLIEPDKVLAKTYQQSLASAGHEVVIAHGAQPAITAADGQQPDLVILELQLIEHSGIEFLYEFRSYDDWQATPVLILSQIPPGEFSASWPLLKGELGVNHYFYKPHTTLRQLLGAVSDYQPQTA